MSARLRHYVCGSTAHDLSAMFRGGAHETREFPAGVFLFDRGDGIRVLFDTGYATGEWRIGWRGTVYRRLLPPKVVPEDDVARQLAADGIDPASVTHVVLSHLHPDHIGGVSRFPGATFVLTAGQQRSLAAPRLRAGIFTGLLPSWWDEASKIVLAADAFRDVDVSGVSLRAADLLGDGSYLVVELPGHAEGHIGALVDGRVLLAGDAAWGSDLLGATAELRTLPRAVQHDPAAYLRTAALLQDLADAGIRISFSHDPLGPKELLA
ncbi:MBL fold metallo-hydrolase [Microbacterium sp. EST19A]|uniref:MBL fold metallo-hydrolase n=1 Tax=Microbacterium sp. EST19A TaxID=2862681 RepID=UPI001CBAA9A1|nr:MBL fold metallo-hydrolase [Microbacterium sp. EST19A]